MTTVIPGTSEPPTFKGRARNLTGEVFGRLKIVGFAGRNKAGYLVWACQCECGKTTIAKSQHLTKGMTRSCGCYSREVTSKRSITHGLSRSPEGEAWRQMIQRCTNKKHSNYRRYGGRGITVCDKWRESFSAFYSDLGHRPTPTHSLDRIDNDGDYEPGNCRWATKSRQSRNQRQSVRLTYQGQTLALPDWADRLGIPAKRIHYRLRRGFVIENVLSPKKLGRVQTHTKGL